MMSYRSWEAFTQSGFLKRFRRREYTGSDIVIHCEKYGVWSVHPFYGGTWIKLKTKTPESLMFQIDLLLLDNNWEVENAFIFPDTDW